MGKWNEEFYRKFNAPQITFAPHSVDNERFARSPAVERSQLLARWGLDADMPVVMFCGKLTYRKRPLDLCAAVEMLPRNFNALFVGDGPLADEVRVQLARVNGVVTGFVNQSELPSYYHAADILVLPSEVEPWGLVVNEAMAAGVLPVVSDRVGAAQDLVKGMGEIYQCGDVRQLAEALAWSLERIKLPEIRTRVQQRAAGYSLAHTAAGFEAAVLAVTPGLPT